MGSPIRPLLDRLDVPETLAAVAIGRDWQPGRGTTIEVRSPIDGGLLASFAGASEGDLHGVVAAAADAFVVWRNVPAPRRGELVRRIGDQFRRHKTDLAALLSWEVGKITQEALGEIQELIDMCDFAVGLSRQLYGLTITSERPSHRLAEQWHPLGPVGVITAFNFPVAVWAWNAMLALVFGDSVVLNPSEKEQLCALACQAIAAGVLAETPEAPRGLLGLVAGAGPGIGRALAASEAVPLVSATGSVRMGRDVAQTVAARLGRSLLELGGNNAMVVAPTANFDLAIPAMVFSAVGTAGQRCTTLRRLIVHESLAGRCLERLLEIYRRLPIGNPLEDGVLVGPLIDRPAAEAMDEALRQAREKGGKVHGGGRVTEGVPQGGRVCAAGHRGDLPFRADRANRDVRTDPVRHDLPQPGGGHCHQQRRLPGTGLGDLHPGRLRGRDVLLGSRFRLRHCERQHRHQRGRDRRGLWRREDHRRRARIGFRRLEGLHAPSNQHRQLLIPASPGPGNQVPSVIPLERGVFARPA